MKPIITFLILVSFVFGSTITVYSQNPEQTYQKALVKEEGEGALPEAIELYKQVADNTSASNSLQAKALLHIGLCYEKLGKEEALKAYLRLVNNFPGQKQEVAVARERLNKLIKVNEIAALKPLKPKFTKIKIPTKLSWSVKLSPDGKELALVSDKKLWKMPLSGNLGSDIPGTPVQVNTNGVEVEWSGLDWSRDGKWIAFNDYPKHNEEGEYIKNQSILIVPSNGGEPKKLIENYRSQRVVNYRISLSPDAKIIAFSSIEENKQHIFSTFVNNILPKQLSEMEAREPVFSPDGKYIAFVKDKNKGIGEGDLGLWVVKAEGGTPNKLADAGKASSPMWSPDGKMIAFLDNSTGKEIKFVPFSNGESTGDVTNIKAPEGIEEIRLLAGWTPDNKIGALFVSKTEFGLYTLPANGGQAAVIMNDIRLFQPRWSRDSKHIYYVTQPLEGDRKSYRQFIASVQSSGGKGNPLQTNINGKSIKQFSFQSGNRISPDGKWIVTSTWTPADTNTLKVHWPTSKIWKVSYDGDDAVQVTNAAGNFSDMSPCWSPDGKKIAFVRFQLEKGKDDIFGGTPKIYSINSSGGEPELLVSITDKYVNSVLWSPDGKTIAYLTKEINQPHTKKLNLYDVKSKETRKIDISSANANSEIAWSPDSKRIALNDMDGKVLKIITLTDESIEEISTGLVDVNIYHLDWSPDGKRFVFGGWKGGGAEFWMLEDFLPIDKLAQKEEAKEPEGIRVRQISKKPYLDDFGTVSRDGRYLSFVDWADGDLAILDLNTGDKRILTKNATLDENPEKFVIGSAISKDGKKVAYSWWRPHHTFDLHIFDIEKKSSKLLYKEDKVEAYPVAWRTDNEIVVIRQDRKKETSQVTLFNVLDGTFQDIITFNRREWPQLCVCPDGNFLAYNTNERGQSNSDIYLLTVDKKDEVPLVVHPANDKVIGWIPNRDEFLFISDRSGTWDLWSIKIAEGKPSGEPIKLYSKIGDVAPVGITENGECFCGFSKRNFNAYILPVNKLTGNPEGNPKIPLAGSIYSKNWSPDGKYMVRAQEGRRSFELILREEKTGIEKRLAKELMFAIGPYWSSDAQSVYFYGMDQKMLQNKGYRGGIYKVDINSNKLEQKLLISDYEYTPSDDDAFPISGHVVSDDQQYLYMLFQNDWIVKHDLNNGKDTILYRHPKFVRGVLKMSPDGNKLLFAIQNKREKMSRLMTISTQGGEEMELCTSQESHISGSAFWSPDGKNVYFAERPKGTNLWRVDANGGTPEKVWETDKGAESFFMHPSGEKISYSVRERITEVRVIEGLVNELNKIYSLNQTSIEN